MDLLTWLEECNGNSMKEILRHLNKKLISKYDKYYIRFIGGQYAEIPCDIKITNSEADNIIDNPEYILDVFNDYRKKYRGR